jgi:DNA-binding beta-propeller fold protein YncE
MARTIYGRLSIAQEGVSIVTAWKTALLTAVLTASANSAQAGSSNSLMDLSADGTLLACTNRDSGTVTIFGLESPDRWAKRFEVPIGHHPEGISFVGSTHQLAAAVYADDVVVLLDADKGEAVARIEVFDEPYGIVSNADGSRLFVTLEFPGKVVEIDPVSRAVVREIDAGKFPRGMALTADGTNLYVTEYLTGAVNLIELASGRTVDAWAGTEQDNLARQIALHPKRDKAYVPHIRSRVHAPHGSGGIFPYVAVLDTVDAEKPASESEVPSSRRKRVQMDSFRGVTVPANPWELALSPDGSQLSVVFSGTDDMFVCTVLDDNYRELQYARMLRTGRNPRAIRYSADGSRFFVYNALDFTISIVNAATFELVENLVACESPLDEETLLGKRLFYSANQPMVGRRWISCSSCHPDGDPDGRTWQQPEGLRSTQPLAGLAWTHPLHWSADRDEVQDFEHTIRGDLMQGKGLIRGELYDSLATPNSGRSVEADALARYTNSHKFSISPFARTTDSQGHRMEGEAGLSDAVKHGREIFQRESVGCVTCHSGPYLCDSRAGALTRHDIGTGNADASEKMGPEYDTPTLIGLYRSAPYLHHGKAATLEEVLTTYNPGDKHGRTSQLSAAEISDLVAFLKALPYEDPEPAAIAEGLKKVEK